MCRTVTGVFSIVALAACPLMAQPSIELRKTVRVCTADADDPVDPQCANLCGSATSLVCQPGVIVRFCYRVTNTGNVTFNSHNLVDDQFGPILGNSSIGLAPGSSIFVTHKQLITANVTNIATWTASNGDVTVTATDSVTVRVDSDGDNVPDDEDNCPNGNDDEHDDNDGWPNSCDNCPGVNNPGQQDSDGDGYGDACDECPDDPLHHLSGECVGCLDTTTDSDGDGTPDCQDGCDNDPDKTSPGNCGCGNAATDTDNDGVPDCNDACPNDPNKVVPQKCGCGNSEADSDGDGTPNCQDECPVDPGKTEPGICGCNLLDRDSDQDSIPDCDDNCPILDNPDQADSDGDGVGDVCAEAFDNFCGNCGTGAGIFGPFLLASLIGVRMIRRSRR